MRIVFTVIIAFVFYTLGAKAGIGRYKQIAKTADALSDKVSAFWDDPKTKKARKKGKKAAVKARQKAVKRVRAYAH
jgi:hypothetical protein